MSFLLGAGAICWGAGGVPLKFGGGVKKRESPDFRSPEVGFLRRRCSKPSVWSICELVHNIVFESCRVTRTGVDPGFYVSDLHQLN